MSRAIVSSYIQEHVNMLRMHDHATRNCCNKKYPNRTKTTPLYSLFCVALAISATVPFPFFNILGVGNSEIQVVPPKMQ